MKSRCSLCFVLGLLSSLALAAPPAPTHDITIEDYATVANIDACAWSPDGAYLVYTQRSWESDKRNSDLWLIARANLQGGGASVMSPPQRLTFEPASDTSPQISPENVIYFLSGREQPGAKEPPYDGKRQVWRMDIDGRNVMPVTRVKGGIGQFQLAADGGAVYYTVSKDESSDEWKDLKKKYADKIEFGDEKREVTELWRLDLQSWRAEKLVDQKRTIRDFCVTRDESAVAMITTHDERLITNEGQSVVEVWNASDKSIVTIPDALWRAQATSPYGWIDTLAWTDDGAKLAFCVSWDGYPTEIYVAERQANGWTAQGVQRPDSVHATPAIAWRAGGNDLYFNGESRARQHVYRVTNVGGGKHGEVLPITQGDEVVEGFALAREPGEQSLAIIASTPASTPEIYLLSPDGGELREAVTNSNPQISDWKLPQMSIVSWKAPDGETVEGVLELPPDYKPGDKPLPMVVEIHGGPSAATPLALRFWGYGRVILPAKGYAVLSPNYRGSTGYSDKFMTDLIGRENDIEVKDILAGVDAMIERGIVDPERLGVMGWSNGGFLTNCVITTTPRFKAASMGAGVVDQFLQWATEDTPGHVINYMRGLPWENVEAYLKGSPAYKLNQVRTPTLIHVGEKDERVPVQHARALYRALRDYLHVPSELLVYPGEPHGLGKASQRMAKMEWDLAWFDRYIRNKPAEPSSN